MCQPCLEGFVGRERVVVKYTVQPDGTVVDGKIFKGSENEKLNTEALRLVYALPKFEVTYYTSDKYPIYFTWPITFEKDSIQ